jgi:hypothetical protein
VTDVARETGARDLKCPQDEVRADLVEHTNPRRYVVSGCGHYVRYACPEVGRAHFECMADEPPQVRSLGESDASAN